jgi:hypothetical protein
MGNKRLHRVDELEQLNQAMAHRDKLKDDGIARPSYRVNN